MPPRASVTPSGQSGSASSATEEKALLAHPHVARRADPEAIQDYLLTGTVTAPRTMFAGIRSLPPGHLLVADEGGVRIRRYWDVPFVEPTAGERTELAARVAERVRSAVAARLVSDVPVGAFLSGGLDSSVVVANAAPAHPGPLPTFTAQYAGNARRLEGHPGAALDGLRGDDAAFAAAVARAFGTAHHEVTEDRLAMAEGLEVRVPLADARVVELVAGVPSSVKLGPRGEKALLRDGPGRTLPAEVRSRVKSPFPVPLAAEAFHARVAALLRARTLHLHRYLERDALLHLAGRLGPEAPAWCRETAFRAWALERWHVLFDVSA